MTFSIDNPRGVATTPLRKICLGKTLRRTRVKELQMVFLISTVINSNGNMKELERKIKCEKLMFR